MLLLSAHTYEGNLLICIYNTISTQIFLIHTRTNTHTQTHTRTHTRCTHARTRLTVRENELPQCQLNPNNPYHSEMATKECLAVIRVEQTATRQT